MLAVATALATARLVATVLAIATVRLVATVGAIAIATVTTSLVLAITAVLPRAAAAAAVRRLYFRRI